MEPSQKQAGDDGRTCNLSRPATQLALRLMQIANSGSDVVAVQVVISDGKWYLFTHGRREALGNE